MNGVSLLLILASIGITPIWRQDESQRTLEYCLQIEPSMRDRMAEGYPITSELKEPEAGIHRFCLRISSTRLENNTVTPDLPELETQQFLQQRPGNQEYGLVLRGRTRGIEQAGITHGWEPNEKGEIIYKIQLSPEVLNTLQPEDELYTPIRAEAGSIHRFELSVGNKQLVRRTTNTNIATNTGIVPPSYAGSGSAYTPGTTRSAYGTSTGPLAEYGNNSGAVYGSNNRGNNFSIPMLPPPPTENQNGLVGYNMDSDSQYDQYGNYLGGYGNRNYLQPNPRLTSGNRNYTSFNSQPSTYSNNSNGNLANTGSAYGTTGGYGSNNYQNNNNNVPNNRYQSQGNFVNQNVPDSSSIVNKPANTGVYGSNAPLNATGNTGGNSGFNSGNSNFRPNGNGYADNGLQDQRFATNTNPVRAGIGSATTGSQPLNRAGTGPEAATVPYIKQDSWQNFLMLMVCALFLSIGGNLYLGWTAAEFYSRYRTAIDRMRGGR